MLLHRLQIMVEESSEQMSTRPPLFSRLGVQPRVLSGCSHNPCPFESSNQRSSGSSPFSFADLLLPCRSISCCISACAFASQKLRDYIYTSFLLAFLFSASSDGPYGFSKATGSAYGPSLLQQGSSCTLQ